MIIGFFYVGLVVTNQFTVNQAWAASIILMLTGSIILIADFD